MGRREVGEERGGGERSGGEGEERGYFFLSESISKF